MTQPPFHPLTQKKPGDRVKLPKHPASADTKYWFGTVNKSHRIDWDNNDVPDHTSLMLHANDCCFILA